MFGSKAPNIHPQARICVKCSKPLEWGDSWHVGMGRSAHARCIDWAQQKFPLEWELQEFRKQWAALKAALRAVEDAGRWLRAFQQRWPQGAAEGMLAWKSRKQRVTAAMRKLRREG